MRAIIAFTLVIAVAAIETGVSPGVVRRLEPITDPDAYAIYATLVPRAWVTRFSGPVRLQRETDSFVQCRSSARSDQEWAQVEFDFRLKNGRPKLLQPVLSMSTPYRLIPKAEITANNVRLSATVRRIFNRGSESLEHAAVSAVGFSSDRTKAMVSVRLRRSGVLHLLQRTDDGWVPAVASGGCEWTA
jgi:hypothetical protein